MSKDHKYHKLIEGCKANDRKSQEELYRTFFDKMLSMCRRYTQDEDQQITIINDGFLKVFKKIDTFGYKGSFEGWVRRLVFNSLSDYFKKENKYIKFMMFESVEKNTDINAEHNLYYQDIIQLTNQLPQKTKLVFEMYAIQGYIHKDIAAELEITISTSKWHLSEARKRLQEILSKRKIVSSNVR